MAAGTRSAMKRTRFFVSLAAPRRVLLPLPERIIDMKRTRIALGRSLSLALLLAWAGCQAWTPPSQPAAAERLTVGTVQRETEIGMDAASVAGILGSPNIVPTDDQRREVWVYDKVSSDRVDSSRSDHAIDDPCGAGQGRAFRDPARRDRQSRTSPGLLSGEARVEGDSAERLWMRHHGGCKMPGREDRSEAGQACEEGWSSHQ